MTDSALPPTVITTPSPRLDLAAAFAALKRLLADKNDTQSVFEIMRALNGGSNTRGYRRLLSTIDGGRLAYERVELADRLSDPAFVASFPAGSFGGAYRAFLEQTGYSADGLAAIARSTYRPVDPRHPYFWFGRRTRDVHDLWHVLTGYKADEGLGEACLVAFSYAQTGGLGWALIAVGAAVRSGLFSKRARAIAEGWRNGRRAAWLLAQDYEALLQEPLADVRRKLRIAAPVIYDAIPEAERDVGLPG